MAKIDIDRVISEYYMLKTVLKNQYAADVMSGKIQPAGPSAAADKKTLQAMQRYVKKLGEVVIPGNGLTANENLDAYLDRITKNFKASELAKPESKRMIYSENPFDDRFKPFVTAVLSKENSRAKIEKAINADAETLNSVNSLVINLGGKKQSSYVKLLSQSTELFSTVSGLQNEIATLQRQRKVDAAEIDRLNKELAEKTKQAEEYKSLCEKAIEELGKANSISYQMFIGMLQQTSANLDSLVKAEHEKTRKHVTNETNRVVDILTAKDKIKTYMFDHGKDYPRYFVVLQNSKRLNNKGMNNLYKELVHAAKQVNLPEDHPAVESLYNDLREQRLKNDNTKSNTTIINNKKKGGKGLVVLGVAAILALAGTTGFFAHQAHILKGQNTQLQQEVADTNAAFDETFKGEYQNYQDRENAQYDEYAQKLQIAVADGTLVSLPGVTPTPGATNGEVWNQESLKALRDRLGSDDLIKVNSSDQIAVVDWASTEKMEMLTSDTINSIRANFYETNYNDLVKEVSNLTGQIADLNNQLDAANALNATLQAQNTQYADQIASLNSTISTLRAQVTSLQNQIDSLNAIIDAAKAQNSDLAAQVNQLTASLNQANAEIADLQGQVDALSAENAALRQQVADLNALVGSLQGEVNTLNSRITVLENENSVLSTEKADLINQVNALQDEIDELKEQIKQMGDNDALYQEKVALEQRVAELEGLLDAANSRISSLQAENEALTNKIVELEESVSNLNKTVDQLESENAQQAATIEKLQKDLTDAINDYNDVYQQYQDLLSGKTDSAEVEALKNKLNEAYNKIENYEQRIVQLYDGITKNSTNPSEAEKALKELFDMFGINYSESDSPSNNNSEYQPQP